MDGIKQYNPGYADVKGDDEADGQPLGMKNYGSIQSMVGQNMQSLFDSKNKHSFKAQINDPNLGTYGSPELQSYNSVSDALRTTRRQSNKNFNQYPNIQPKQSKDYYGNANYLKDTNGPTNYYSNVHQNFSIYMD